MFTVAVYLVDKAFGGSEEGGWYYETGVPSDEHAQHSRGFDNEEQAVAYAKGLDKQVCQELNVGRYPISSVLSQGQYSAEVREGQPKAYPETRPRYE